MTAASHELPWTLIAALVAAAASLLTLLINTLVLTSKHKRDALAQIASRRFEWAHELRQHASEYAAHLAMFQKAKEEQDKELFDRVQPQLFEKIHSVMLMLKQPDRDEIEHWHDEVLAMIGDNKFDAARKNIEKFATLICGKLEPEIVRAELELQGKVAP